MTGRQLGAVVLCGGESRRMGRDKASLPFGPETMLERVLRLIARITENIVVAAAEGQPVGGTYRITRDAEAGEGPLPGLLRAAALLDTDYLFVAAVDTPLLEPALIPLLYTLAQGAGGAVPCVAGVRATACAVYRRDALLGAREAFGDPSHGSLRAYVSGLPVREVDEATLRTVDPGLRSFMPCNTPEQYREALRAAGLAASGPPLPAV